MTNKIFLSLGSNDGDRIKNLHKAISSIKKIAEINRISSFYLTEPVDVVKQNDFINLALEISTGISPERLLSRRFKKYKFDKSPIFSGILPLRPMLFSLSLVNLPFTIVHTTESSIVFGSSKQSEFEEIVGEAVSFEKEFVTAALPVDLIGMNKDLMCRYIEAVADRIADLFEFERVFNTENPFDFMRALDVQNVTNFFEKRVSEYQRPKDRALTFDETF